ncbi:MAG TPA: S53 family peptidase [Candidatus Xenobia bacterium]|jgi:kumamolisin
MNALSALGNTRPPAAKEDRVELPGSSFPAPPGSVSRKAANPAEPLTVSLILKSPKPLPDAAGPFKQMSAEEHKQYEASPAQIEQVRRFAKTNGLSVASVDAETRTVKLQGTVADCDKAFGVKLNQMQAGGKSFRGYQGTASLPRSLASQVEGVFGLSDRAAVRPRAVMAPKGFGGSGYMAPEVGQLYNFPKGVDGTGQTIGIIEFGGGYNQADLKRYFDKAGLPVPKITSVGIDGVDNKPNVDNDVDGEVALDIEVAGSVAPGANVVVYFAPDTEQGFIDAINTAAHDKVNNPKTLSISWGSPEDSKNDPPPSGWSDAGRTAVDQACKDAANLGVNIFVASGDDGSADGTHDGKPHADMPASSPSVVAVGGTRLDSDGAGHKTGEVAWGDGSWGGASGGGISKDFPVPDFQKDLKLTGRGTPDVAGNAAPETGYDVIWDGSEQSIGGTSASAPLWAGLTALLGQGVGQPLGYLNPFYYQHPEAFNDITEGNNGAYKAGPGWDAVTGMGSPDGGKMLAALKAQAPKQS